MKPTRRKALHFVLFLCMLALSAMGSAQTTTGGGAPDLTPITNAASTQFISFMTTNAPGIITIMLTGLAFGLVLRMLRKGVKG